MSPAAMYDVVLPDPTAAQLLVAGIGIVVAMVVVAVVVLLGSRRRSRK